ncbi:MAG: M20 family metallopeptidase [Thermodesulfobacteriota bacterium]
MKTPWPPPDPEFSQWLIGIRRAIHRWPELAFQETRTQELICRELSKLAIPFRTHRTGVIARLGPTEGEGVALRADMDALPIAENTGLPFSSENSGVMHACGHDGHVAMLLGAAALLREESLPGPVILIFQPAEEGGAGAETMITAGALAQVRMIFAGHIDRHFQAGEIAVQPGLICAFTDEFTITIEGKGGHAAKPHETTDIIVVASLLVMSIQTLVSRETNPVFPSVVTVGRIRGGTAPNVIAHRAVLEGTIRTTMPQARQKIISGLQRMVAAMEELYSAAATIDLEPGYPAVINEPGASGLARQAAELLVGTAGVKEQGHPSLGGEDFAFYLNRVPGCLVRLGASPGPGAAPAHSPQFDFDEAVLPLGAAFLAQAALLGLAQP